MFFGWGRRTKQWPLGPGLLVCSYRSVHLWWFFRLAFGERWILVHDQRSQDRELSHDEAQRLLPTGTVPLGLGERYGLLLTAAAIAVVFALGQLVSGITG